MLLTTTKFWQNSNFIFQVLVTARYGDAWCVPWLRSLTVLLSCSDSVLNMERDQTVHHCPKCLGFLWRKNGIVDKKGTGYLPSGDNWETSGGNPSPRSFSYFFLYCLTLRSTKFQIFGRNSINRSDNSSFFKNSLELFMDKTSNSL